MPRTSPPRAFPTRATSPRASLAVAGAIVAVLFSGWFFAAGDLALAAPLRAANGSEVHGYRVTLGSGGSERTVELEAFSLPGSNPAHRLVFCPESGEGFPVAAIALDARGRPRPELAHPQEREFVEAFLAWFEVHRIVDDRWLNAGAEGTVSVRIPSLGMRHEIPLRYRVTEDADGGHTVRVDIEKPVVQEGNMKVELKVLDWTVRTDEQGRVHAIDLSHELIRSAGQLRQEANGRTRIELRSREDLSGKEARSIEGEFDLLASAARALIGNNPEEIEKAQKTVQKYRDKYSEGRLSGALVRLDLSLSAYADKVAGVIDPDAAAEKLIGKPAPDFTLTDTKGNEVTLSSFVGKPVVLSFWGYT